MPPPTLNYEEPVKSWQCGCSCLPDSSVACLAGCEGGTYNKTDRRSGMEVV